MPVLLTTISGKLGLSKYLESKSPQFNNLRNSYDSIGEIEDNFSDALSEFSPIVPQFQDIVSACYLELEKEMNRASEKL